MKRTISFTLNLFFNLSVCIHTHTIFIYIYAHTHIYIWISGLYWVQNIYAICNTHIYIALSVCVYICVCVCFNSIWNVYIYITLSINLKSFCLLTYYHLVIKEITFLAFIVSNQVRGYDWKIELISYSTVLLLLLLLSCFSRVRLCATP